MLTVNHAQDASRSPARLKRALNQLAMVLVAPCALTCWAEQQYSAGASGVFSFWTHTMAILPGAPGRFLRRAFYRWTLAECAEDVTIEFGAVFSRRNVVLANGVYVGAYALIGSVRIGEYTLIGSRVSLLSGGQHHTLLPSGHWSPTDSSRLTQIEIGHDNWIGEGAIVMANMGNGCMVAAGAVVSAAVPSHVMVAGNPARFVRHLKPSADSSPSSVPQGNLSSH